MSRVPPHSVEAEQAVLGALLLYGSEINSIELDPSEFYLDAHRAVFRVMRELEAKGSPIDTITVSERMSPDTRAVDTVFLSDLLGRSYSVSNLQHYASIVKAKAAQRKIALVASEIAAIGLEDPGDDYEEVATRLWREATASTSTAGPRDLKDICKESFQILFDRIEGKASPGVPTGYKELDLALCGGMQVTDLIILAARPGMGKTALSENIALNTAFSGHPVLFFSLEMNSNQLCERMISSEAEVNMMDVRNGLATRTDLSNIASASSKISALDLKIDDSAYLNLQSVISKARRWASGLKGTKPGLIVLDYLQLLRLKGKNKNQNREQEVSECCNGLKQLAKELKVPVMALAQLNRGLEYREDKRPILADLRESGAIEQDADVIMFIYRDEYYNKTTAEIGKAELLLRKNRNGASPADINLLFENKFTKFKPYPMDF